MKLITRITLFSLLLITSFHAKSQQSLLALDEAYYHMVDRYAILNQDSLGLCTSIKPFNRNHIPYVVGGTERSANLSRADAFNFLVLKQDNWDVLPGYMVESFRTTRLKRQNFYQYPGSFFSVNVPDFKLVVNPILGFASGKSNGDNIYRNTRGIELRGSIANKVGFYSFISENQFVYPDYYNHQIDQLQVIPGTGFIKSFGNNGYDFFNAQGYITFQANKFIDLQFGHDKNFIGNGYRSLIISDVAKEHLFLKLHTHVWRFNYVNLFSELTDFRFNGVKHQQKKYAAFHYLNFNVIPNKLDIGVFENIVFARNDSNQQAGYEIGYLNPIIFYRAAEHSLNSTDNSLIGADLKWNFARGFSFYSQLVLDEFHKYELVNRTGSWVNKWAFQTGLKYLNVAGIPNLDLQVEMNRVRPYVYTHFKTDQAWTHFSQPMAHPIGANFKEMLAIVRYQITPRINVVAKYFNIVHGADSTMSVNAAHFGGNIFGNYNNRPKETDIKIGDGVQQKINILDVTCSYQIYQRIFFDLRYVYRDGVSELPLKSFNTSMVILGARMNIGGQRFDF